MHHRNMLVKFLLPLLLSLPVAASLFAMDSTTLIFARVMDTPSADTRPMTMNFGGNEEILNVERIPQLTDAEIKDIIVIEGESPSLRIILTDEGQKKFTAMTQEVQGKRIAIHTPDQLLSAPLVRDVITGDTVEISGNFTPAQAKLIVDIFHQGKGR